MLLFAGRGCVLCLFTDYILIFFFNLPVSLLKREIKQVDGWWGGGESWRKCSRGNQEQNILYKFSRKKYSKTSLDERVISWEILPSNDKVHFHWSLLTTAPLKEETHTSLPLSLSLLISFPPPSPPNKVCNMETSGTLDHWIKPGMLSYNLNFTLGHETLDIYQVCEKHQI